MINDLITVLMLVNKEDKIYALGQFSDDTIRELRDSEIGEVSVLALCEWQRRKIVILEEDRYKKDMEIVELHKRICQRDQVIRELQNKTRDTENENESGINPTEEELQLAQDEGRVAAVRRYRGRTGLSLRESKEAIEKAMEHEGLVFKHQPL